MPLCLARLGNWIRTEWLRDCPTEMQILPSCSHGTPWSCQVGPDSVVCTFLLGLCLTPALDHTLWEWGWGRKAAVVTREGQREG